MKNRIKIHSEDKGYVSIFDTQNESHYFDIAFTGFYSTYCGIHIQKRISYFISLVSNSTMESTVFNKERYNFTKRKNK